MEEGLATYKEYIDYIFPEETQTNINLGILEAAYKWKKQRVAFKEN